MIALVLSICAEDFAEKKCSGISKVFEVLSNVKIFLTRFETTIFYVTTWKILRTLGQHFPLKFVLAEN